MSTLELFIRHSHYPYSAQKSSLITTRDLKRTPPPEESESLQPNAPRSDWGIILIRFHKHTSHWAHDEPPILFGYSVNQQHIHSNRLWVKGGAAQADRFRLIVLVYFFRLYRKYLIHVATVLFFGPLRTTRLAVPELHCAVQSVRISVMSRTGKVQRRCRSFIDRLSRFVC